MAEMKRQTAYKVRISDILNANYVVQEGWESNYIITQGKKVSRINVMGTVVLAENNKLLIDDGSGTISLQSFENAALLSGFLVGDIVLVVGRPREYNGAKYINAELVRKMSVSWFGFRKKELELLEGSHKEPEEADERSEGAIEAKGALEEESIEEEVRMEYPETTPQKIIHIIQSLDAGDGVEIEEILKKVGKCEETLESMIRRGEIFENKRGRVKVL